MTTDEKELFIATAEPFQIVAMFPREYTLQMRMGPSMWHTSAVRMTALEITAYDLACGVREFELDVKFNKEKD